MFFPVFDKERVISMGDIAIAPSNPNIIYAGTGEEDSRNSISRWRSLQVDRCGTHLEAERSRGDAADRSHHRRSADPNVVYVAALGHAWNSNPERGVYKSTDGGTTWQLVKFVSDKGGFVDLAMDAKDHNTLYGSSGSGCVPVLSESGGPGSGLWKTTDAGVTWHEVRGGGFPETMKEESASRCHHRIRRYLHVGRSGHAAASTGSR